MRVIEMGFLVMAWVYKLDYEIHGRITLPHKEVAWKDLKEALLNDLETWKNRYRKIREWIKFNSTFLIILGLFILTIISGIIIHGFTFGYFIFPSKLIKVFGD